MLDTGACLSCCVYLCRFVQGRLASAPRPIVELGCCSGRTQRWGRLSRTEDRRDSPQPRRPGLAPCLLQEPRSSGQLRQVREVRAYHAHPACAGGPRTCADVSEQGEPWSRKTLTFQERPLSGLRQGERADARGVTPSCAASCAPSVHKKARGGAIPLPYPSWAKPSMRSMRFRVRDLRSILHS